VSPGQSYQELVAHLAATVAGPMAHGVPDRDLHSVARRAILLARQLADLALQLEGPA